MNNLIYREEKNIDVDEPVIFENKTDSDFEVSAGIVFRKSGLYDVSIVGRRTIISKVAERKERMMPKFDPLRFIADHAGLSLADAISEAYRQGQQDAQHIFGANDGDTISRQAAKLKVAGVIWEDGDSCDDFHDKCVDCLDDVPPTLPESYKVKLKAIADELSEKFAYMNTCLNERDVILGYLGVKRCCEIHCNTDCTNTKCESHPLSPAQPEPLTDKEQRIFLAAMGREEKVCKQVDEECRDCREPYEDSLVRTCHEITRKVKGALWDGN